MKMKSYLITLALLYNHTYGLTFYPYFLWMTIYEEQKLLPDKGYIAFDRDSTSIAITDNLKGGEVLIYSRDQISDAHIEVIEGSSRLYLKDIQESVYMFDIRKEYLQCFLEEFKLFKMKLSRLRRHFKREK
jgi:hypothetical protein